MLPTGKYGIQNDGWLAGLVAKSCRTLCCRNPELCAYQQFES